jgi:hypothetical protein
MPLGKDMGAWIEDFQNSKNEKFAGKSKEERTKMAKAAYMAKYGEKKMEEAIDVNDPALVKARAAAHQRTLPKPEIPKPVKTINPAWKAAKNADKIRALKKQRAQLMIDMEQEAEPEGGPIANRYGRELNKIDKAIAMLSEAKATYCGRCGHTHVKGTPCPRPFKEEVDLTEAKSFTIDTESATDSDKITDFLTSENIKFTKTGSKIKISLDRSTPKASVILSHLNRISKFEELNEGGDKPDFLDIDKDGNKTEPMKKAAKDAKKGIEEARENDIIASIDPKHPLATKDIEDWTAEDQKEFKKLRDKHHGNDKIKDMLKKAVTTKLKEAGTMSPEDKKANDLEIQAQKAKIAAAQDRITSLQKVTEAKHPILEVREYDYEGQMARTQLISIVKNAKSLFDSIGEKTQLQGWVQSKLTKAEDYLNAVRSYLDGESISNTAPLMINNEPAKDDEGTALSVGDVIRGADGKIYQAVHSYSEGKAFLTPFDLKKRKTTNLSQRHYFDAVAENEMSPTMKMYKVMPHTQTKGGFTK